MASLLGNDFSFLCFLRWLQLREPLAYPLSHEVCLLWLKVSFLHVFVSCGGRKHNNIENRVRLQALLVYIRTVFQSVDLDIRLCQADFTNISSKEESEAFDLRFCNPDIKFKRRRCLEVVYADGRYIAQQRGVGNLDIKFKGRWFPMNTVDLLSRVQRSLELLKPHIHEVYTILSNSSSTSTLHGDSSQAAMKNLDFLIWNIKILRVNNAEMVAPVDEELEAAQKSLESLRDLLGFTTKRCSKLSKLKDLIIHAEFVANEMSCLLYMCSFNEAMNDEMKANLSSELQKFSFAQRHVRQIYIKALKASNSPRGDSAVVDESGLAFFYSLEDNILQLPGTNLSFMASNKDHMLSLHEELKYLTKSFGMYKSPETHSAQSLHIEAWILNPDQISNNFMERISAAIVHMGCLIYSLHNNEAMESVSDLQDIIKTVKEDARKAYDMYVPKSWQSRTKFQRTSAKGLEDFLNKTFKSILRVLYIHSLPLHWELLVEMVSLTEGFKNLTENQGVDDEELEILMMRLNDIRNETENLISGTFWSHNLWSFFLIEEIKMIRMEFNLPKTVCAWGCGGVYCLAISDEEAEEIGEQMINGYKRSHIFSINAGMSGIEDQMKWLETNLKLMRPLRNEVKELRFRAGFLKVFLSFEGKWHIEDGNLKALLTHICSVFQDANQDTQRLWTDMIQISPKREWCLPVNMDCLLASVIARLQLLEPDIQEVYSILSKSSRFITGMSDEAIMENLNSLQENINVLLECNTGPFNPLKKELEAVQESLRFSRNFLGFTTKRCSKLGKLKDLLIHFEFLADKISCLLYLCCDNEKMNYDMVNETKMHLSYELHKFSPAQPYVREIYIKALKTSKSAKGNSNFAVMDEFDLGFLDSLIDNILELSSTNLSFIISNKDQIVSLLDKLKFLFTFCAMDKSLEQHYEHDQMFDDLFKHINPVIIDIGCVIYSINDDEKSDKMARELKLNKKISDLEAIISDTRRMFDLDVPESSRSNFQITNGQDFIYFLFRYLEGLINSKADLVARLKHYIEMVQKGLLSLSEDFIKISIQSSHCEELHSQWTHFLEIAYQTQYVIDSFLSGDRPLYCHKLGLFHVIEDIKTIKIELKAMENKLKNDTSSHKLCCFSTEILEESKKNTDLSPEKILTDENSTTKLLVFGEEAEKIREQLMRGSKKVNILSIVGMPGIGKTTLADSVFQHSSVTYHFHVRARCSVSQVHDKRRLLLEILGGVLTGSKQYNDNDNDDLEMKLYKGLKGRKYLILLDDVWNIQPWKDIKACFPDDKNGSRILFTSRFEGIASQIGIESIQFCLSPLPEKKSWEMLQVKLFGNKRCPLELVSVGYEIAANCKGLPLTIDLIAAVLRTKERKEWKKVSESLMKNLLEDPQGHCRKVLELSYQNLSDGLKPCFLYFAAFPEDANVSTRDLILLWIAEGFVKQENGKTKSLEDVAKDILDDLIRRSLVIVSKRGPLGGVDASHVHDLLHEFAVAKAQEESFMLQIDCKTDFIASPVHDQQYRLCIYPDNLVKFPKENSFDPCTRALICSRSLVWDHLSLIFGAFKLLKVLYIPNLLCPYCPEMFRLIHLTLLSITTSDSTSKIFSKIHKFWKLETLIVNCRNRAREYFLPHTISSMVRLRHICFEGLVSLRHNREKLLEKSSIFYNLRTLYHLQASYGEEVEKILNLMPNLVELKILFYDSNRCVHPFPRLDFLKKLESLEVTHSSQYPCKIINFPPRLKRLILSHFDMPWTEISEIGNHKSLEVLELKNGAFRGPIWDMIDGQFPKLKYLSLSDLDIEEWNASKDHLSCLEQLHVAKCRKLKELPSCLIDIATLRRMELFYCTKTAENLAKTIKEEQVELGNEQLVVDITEDFWKHI